MIAEYQQNQAVRQELKRLTIVAPFDGHWLDVNPEWREGQWVGSKEALGNLLDTRQWQADAYVLQDEVPRLSLGDRAYFYPNGAASRIPGRIVAIGSTRVNELDHPPLSSRFGGPIPTAAHGTTLAPTQAVFHVLVQLDAAPAGLLETIGQTQLEGRRRSILKEGLDRFTAILLRESGF